MKQKSKDGIKQHGTDNARMQQRDSNQSAQDSYQGQSRQSADNPEDELIGMDESAELQHSAQREGMGRHRHSARGNQQGVDGAIDIADLGNRRPADHGSR